MIGRGSTVKIKIILGILLFIANDPNENEEKTLEILHREYIILFHQIKYWGPNKDPKKCTHTHTHKVD